MHKARSTTTIHQPLLEEKRRPQVSWESSVIVLARSAAWYAALLGGGATAAVCLWYGMPAEVAAALVLVGAALLAGFVGGSVLLIQDHNYEYAPALTRLVQQVEEDAPGPPLEAQQLARKDGSRILYGKVKLQPAQLLALARLVVVNDQDLLSGRALEAAGVISDRISQAGPLQEDLLALGYAKRKGKSVEATQALAEYLDQFLPPPHS